MNKELLNKYSMINYLEIKELSNKKGLNLRILGIIEDIETLWSDSKITFNEIFPVIVEEIINADYLDDLDYNSLLMEIIEKSKLNLLI